MRESLVTIIPYYKPDYFLDTLYSVANNSVTPERVIVSDDSRDGSLNIFRGDIRDIESEHNLKISVLDGPKRGTALPNILNAISHLSQHDRLVHVLFDDDLLFPDFYETHLIMHTNRSLGCSISSRYNFRSNANHMQFTKGINYRDSTIESSITDKAFNYFSSNCLNVFGEFSNAIFKKYILEDALKIIAEERIIGLSDFRSFLYAHALSNNVHHFRYSLSGFRQHKASNSQNTETSIMYGEHLAWIHVNYKLLLASRISEDEWSKSLKITFQRINARYNKSSDISTFTRSINPVAHPQEIYEKYLQFAIENELVHRL